MTYTNLSVKTIFISHRMTYTSLKLSQCAIATAVEKDDKGVQC